MGSSARSLKVKGTPGGRVAPGGSGFHTLLRERKPGVEQLPLRRRGVI